MSTQFTPGPWQIKDDYTKEGACTIIANVDGDTHSDGSTTYSYDFICTCEDEFGEYTEHAEANARLIGHAPDLYAGGNEAADFLLSYFGPVEDFDNRERWSDPDAFDVYKQLTKALRGANRHYGKAEQVSA